MRSFENKVALVTGSAGFIGFFVCRKLLDEGWRVIGLDCLSDYYDVSLKQKREKLLQKSQNYISVRGKIQDRDRLRSLFDIERPNLVIHLAAQAGVRYSIINPRSYLDNNIIGTFELLEAAREFPPKHMLLASTSSAYGINDKLPFCEIDKSDHQVSFYAATKKSTENLAHSYSHLYHLPITMFRFFTVYGPWGRPDMAFFKFTRSILKGEPIDVYNHGEMERDFTYIDDLVRAIWLLVDVVPSKMKLSDRPLFDSLSPVAPFRTVNIGNSKTTKLSNFIEAIEEVTEIRAVKNLMPMQAGDVPVTWASVKLLKHLINYVPDTEIKFGVKAFVDWYRDYYQE